MEATRTEPTLSALASLAIESGQRLVAIADLLPPGLQQTVRPGPINGETWCLLVSNAAALTKLRHQVPEMVKQLQSKGYEITAIRLKIQAPD